MPKQIIEINPFHGGMNNNTDPRDLQHDELANAQDIMVDRIGRIRTGPDISAHASNSPSITIDSIDDRPGTSLFAFSHDYVNAGFTSNNLIKNGSSNMNSGTIWGGWTASTDWGATSSQFTFIGTTGGSDTITQTAANRIDSGHNSKSYTLTYTISDYALTSGSPSLKIKGGSGEFASADVALTLSNGTHTKVFTSHSSASTGVFSLQSASVQVVFKLDNILLKMNGLNSTGDNYLALYMNTSSKYRFAIYSYSTDTWTFKDDGLRFNSVSSTANPVFSYADGVLRIVDGLKGENAYKIWYSYIQRFRWGTTTSSVDLWAFAQSSLIPPIDADIPIDTNSPTSNYTPDEGKFLIANPHGFTTNVSKSGTWNPNGVSGTSHGSSSDLRKLVASSDVFTSNMVGLKVVMGSDTSTITGFESTTVVHTESVNWADSTAFHVYEQYDIGFSWMYDGNQESLIHNRTIAVNTQKNNWSFIIDTIRCGYDWDTETTARKTGMQMYYRKNSDTSKTWYHLGEFDFNKGFRKSDEDDFTITWSQVTLDIEYKLDNIIIHNTPTLETYESRNGYKNNINQFLDLSDPDNEGMGYSVSTIANRVHYIANVKYKNSEGAVRNYGDVMFKSVVNKFDTFPLSRRLEVSVQDGDEITALASYADRLLQYKKNKMHLINISQEVEFLEDTFKFKGVESQASVCETDFGIAWVNLFGCYLYDGRQVLNLLEQKGVRKISHSSWNDSQHKPSIAYSPKKRQLVIGKDYSGGDIAAGNGDAWIYDMVTKSWVLQVDNGEYLTDDGGGTSNLVTDHLGNIVFCMGTGDMKTIDMSSSGAKSGINIKTADMNYGDSGVRKKVYRVRLSYKGDASSLNVRYSTNGDTNTLRQFEGTSSGLPNGSATNTPLENKASDTSQWHHAELKPADSSKATNIFSFQVHMTGTAGATFEINDLSVVFRIKNVK